MLLLEDLRVNEPHRAARGLAESLVRGGHRVSLASLDDTGTMEETFAAAGCQMLAGFADGVGRATASWRFRKLVGAAMPDMVLAVDATRDVLLALAAAGLRRNRPGLACWFRPRSESLPALRLLSMLIRRRLIDVVACPSRAVRRGLEIAGLPRRKLALLRDGVDTAGLAWAQPDPLADRPGRTVFVQIANLDDPEQAGPLLDAAGQLARDRCDFHLLLAGRNTIDVDMMQRVAQAGAGRVVTLLGPHEHPQRLLAGADVAVHAAGSCGMPLVALEAMAAGRALLLTEGQGLGEWVTDGREGLVVPAEADALTEAMRTLIAQPRRLAMMSRWARRTARRHDSSRTARGLQRLCRTLAPERPTTPARTRPRRQSPAAFAKKSAPSEQADVPQEPSDTPPAWASPSLRHVSIAVTGRCKGRCVTCNLWRREDHAEDAIAPEQLDHLPPRLRSIELTGGEPFLRRDLPDLVGRAYRRCPRARLSIVTDGQMTERILADVARMGQEGHRPRVVVSLDGIAEAHDRVRGVQGAFDRAVATLDGLRKMGHAELALRMTVSAANLDQIENVAKFADWGGVELEIRSAQPMRTALGIGRLDTPSAENLATAGAVLDRLWQAGLRSFKPARWRTAEEARTAWLQLIGQGGSGRCSAGMSSVYIAPDGQAYQCGSLGIPMGLLSGEPDESARWRAKMAKQFAAGCSQTCRTRRARPALLRGLAMTAWKLLAHLRLLQLPAPPASDVQPGQYRSEDAPVGRREAADAYRTQQQAASGFPQGQQASRR